jgi:hypothetical protein
VESTYTVHSTAPVVVVLHLSQAPVLGAVGLPAGSRSWQGSTVRSAPEVSRHTAPVPAFSRPVDHLTVIGPPAIAPLRPREQALDPSMSQAGESSSSLDDNRENCQDRS